MKSKAAIAALTAVSLTFSGLALAQDRDGRQGRDERGGPPQYQRGGPEGQRNNGRGPENRPPQQAHMDQRGERGAGPDHNYYRGGRLPPQYRSRSYVVDDWRGHHLSPPPRGYHWVQTGADYVLVAVATGIIAQILLGQ